MSDITVENLRAKVDQYLDLKQKIKLLENQAAYIQKELTPITQELIEIMEAMDLDRFEGSKGRITKVKQDYVSNPSTDADREAFQTHLKEQGLFDEMVSVHHAKLNSYFKDQLAQSIEEGRELNIPGLTPKQRIEIRKTR